MKKRRLGGSELEEIMAAAKFTLDPTSLALLNASSATTSPAP